MIRRTINGIKIVVFDGVYNPSDDTYLLLDDLVYGDIALDMCTGTGIIAIALAKRAKRVIAVDIDPKAVECARYNVKLNGVEDKVVVIQSDLFKNVSGLFDVIVCNPPYLPCSNNACDKRWCGGPDGLAVIRRFFKQAHKFLRDDGVCELVASSEKALEIAKTNGFDAKILKRKRFFFEELLLIIAKKRSTSMKSKSY